MNSIQKYPRTPHLFGSLLQPGDEDLSVISRESLEGLPLVIEEKLDGSNSGISFDSDGSLVIQSRGHILTGGPRERQFDLLKRWANHHREALHAILGRRYLIYGEWLFAKHTIAYDQLPHFFMEFDILDRQIGHFLSTDRRMALLAGSPVLSVPILGSGPVTTIDACIGRSCFSTTELMEGLYLKQEQDGKVIGRYKYVRSSFLQAVADSDSHWMERPIEPNRLRTGVDLFA